MTTLPIEGYHMLISSLKFYLCPKAVRDSRMCVQVLPHYPISQNLLASKGRAIAGSASKSKVCILWVSNWVAECIAG